MKLPDTAGVITVIWLVGFTPAPSAHAMGEPAGDTARIRDTPTPTESPINTWTGSNHWNSASNWSLGRTPEAGDDVRIGGGWVMLTNATPELFAFTLNSGVLTFSNWDACVAASNVMLSSGTVTHAANTDTIAADGWTPNGRVYFRCHNLALGPGVTINAAGKGYRNSMTNGCGPGGGTGGGNASAYAGGGGGGRIAVWRWIDAWTGTPSPGSPGSAADGGAGSPARELPRPAATMEVEDVHWVDESLGAVG
jgi:hypothetical protein